MSSMRDFAQSVREHRDMARLWSAAVVPRQTLPVLPGSPQLTGVVTYGTIGTIGHLATWQGPQKSTAVIE